VIEKNKRKKEKISEMLIRKWMYKIKTI